MEINSLLGWHRTIFQHEWMNIQMNSPRAFTDVLVRIKCLCRFLLCNETFEKIANHSKSSDEHEFLAIYYFEWVRNVNETKKKKLNDAKNESRKQIANNKITKKKLQTLISNVCSMDFVLLTQAKFIQCINAQCIYCLMFPLVFRVC